jgi:ribokinase
VPARRVTAVDTTAAGDTLAGVLTTALAEGRTLPDALTRATTASALAVQRRGSSRSIPYKTEIDAATGGSTCSAPNPRMPTSGGSTLAQSSG